MIYNQVLPSSVGGDAIRIALLAPRTGLSSAGRSVGYDRLVGGLTLALIVAVTIPCFFLRQTQTVIGTTAVVVALLVIAIASAVLVVISRLEVGLRAPGLMRDVISDCKTFLADKRRGFLILVTSTISHLLSFFCYLFLLYFVGANVAVVDVLLLTPPVLLLNTLPISVGGWGVREGLMASAFALVGANPADVVSASLLFGLTTPVSGVVIWGGSKSWMLAVRAWRARRAASRLHL